MKKILLLFAFLMLQLFLSTSSYAAPAKIKVIVRGKALTMDTAPVVSSGRTLVPMRDIFECLDAYVEWNDKTKSITATRSGKVVKLKIGDKKGFINDTPVVLDASPSITKGRTLVPLRFVGEAFGAKVEWDNGTRTINISTDDLVEKTYNTSGNINNEGYVCSSGDYDYISFYNLGTYKIKHGSSEKVKINGNPVSFINIVGDWMYFVYSEKYPVESERDRLYRMKLNGTSSTKITSDKVLYASIVDDWIYYINQSDYDRPYKIRLDGKGRQKISDDTVSNLVVSNGWIFFERDGDLCRMRTNGKDESVLCEEITGNLNFNNTKDTLIFSLFNDEDRGIYKIKTNGTGIEKIVSTSVNSLNYSEGFIYYNDFLGNLYKIKEDGSEKKKISTGVKGSLNISGDWIYYTSYVMPKSLSDMDIPDEDINSNEDMESDEDNEISEKIDIKSKEFRVKTDGSVKQNMDKEGIFQDIQTFIPGTTSSTPMPITVTSVPRPQATLSPKDIAKHTEAIYLIKTFDEDGEPIGSGTGFNIESSGIIVTNYHVIEGATTIKCSVNNSTTYDVEYILNYNVMRDIAILKLKNTSNLPFLSLGDSDKLELAEEVVAIGNPLELQNSVSTGIVSGLRVLFGMSYIQTSAAISPGNSGGPLINSYGEVIGITTMSMANTQNINFAVPINSVKKLFPTAAMIPLLAASREESVFEESEPNNTLEKAADYPPNSTMEGTIKDEKDLDYFKFNLTNKCKVILVGISEGAFLTEESQDDLSIILIDSNGKQIAKSVSQVESELKTQNLTMELEPGSYYILVKSAEGYKAEEFKDNSSNEYGIIFLTD
ncbi:MAG TPA: DUF5050 domain-containing protein [Pseudobacteroides sp.]|uniref:DUF5050 domain-containing protein n=1 Tax=Pseudobacteroides sp. TaxID=1968840 RepID=UPI002F924307